MKNTSKKLINYYDLLGINSKADAEEIKRAYYDKLKIWHPDKNVGNTEAAEEKTKMLNQAYSVLSDPAQRKQYDRILRYTKGKDFSRILNETEFWRKVERASPTLKHIIEDLKDLYGIFIDSIKGRYKLHPGLLSIIGGGLLYFIIPLDFIPDYIPIVGLLDDFAVLSAIINSMQAELSDYRKSKSK